MNAMMTIPQMIQALLAAPQKMQSKVAMLLSGDESVAPQPIADARTCTQAEAARRLGVSRTTAIKWIREGRLAAIYVAGVPRVLLSSIDAFARGEKPEGIDQSTSKELQERAMRRSEAGRKGAAARCSNFSSVVSK